MVKRLILLPFLFLLFFSQMSMADEFTATVDRNKIGEQDTFTLKLRINKQVLRGQPDLQPLEQDFRIRGQQRSQQFRSINGKAESFTEWHIGLTPRRTGTLTIPAFTFKGESTQPITIEVLPPSAESIEQAEKDFFFETEVTPTTQPLVQSQLLYKEKLYYAVEHTDATLSNFAVNNARVQQLGGVTNHTTVINGRNFGVFERNFTIFPETAGELEIPAQQFIANIPNTYDRFSRSHTINISSQPLKINVAAIPASFPADAVWLPASQLSLSERFSKEPSQWQAGEAVTRTISIQAHGIPGNQLPNISLPEIDHLRYYPDQAIHDERVTESGIIGHAEQSVAIVASSGGEYTLPEVRIPWWNTQTNTLEYAVLPAHNITVTGAAIPVDKEIDATATSGKFDNHKTTAADSSVDIMQQWPLWLMLALLCVSLMINVLLLIRRNNQPALPVAPVNTKEKDSSTSLKQYWQAFSEACSKNIAADIRHSLLAWVNAGGLTGTTLTVTSLTFLAKQVSDPALVNALLELDSVLYSDSNNSAFNGQNLKALIQKESKKPKRITENNGL